MSRLFVPQGWRLVRLADVAEHCLGKMLDAQKNRGRPMPYLRNPNVRWFDCDLSDVREMLVEPDEDERYGLRAGDVLVCEGGEAGRAAIWDGRVPEMKFQKAIHRVRVGRELFNRFLVYRLKFDYESGRLADYYTGTTIKHLTGQDLARYQLPLPPLEEQRRIADILDRADALRAKRRAALALLDELTQSIFLDMFGDPATNPKGWPTLMLAELCEVAGEYGMGVASVQLRPGMPRYIRITDVTSQGALNDDAVGPDATEPDWANYLLHVGDVLFARSGATVGKTYIHRSATPAVFAGYMIRFRTDATRLHPEYLFQFTRTDAYRVWVQRRQRVVAQPNINATQYGELGVHTPPLSLQAAFASRVAALRVLADSLARSLAEMDALFASLQDRAFRGEL